MNQARRLLAADGEQNPDYLAPPGAELHWQANHYLETGDFDRGLVAAREGLEFATRHFGPKDGTHLIDVGLPISNGCWVDCNLSKAILILRLSIWNPLQVYCG